MRLIESSVEIIPQEPWLDGIYKQCELAGRTAYKSQDRITEGSAKKFVDAMIKSNHGAVLEHGTVYLYIFFHPLSENIDSFKQRYCSNPYSKVFDRTTDQEYHLYITTNLRVLFENGWMDDLQYLCEPTEYHERRITAKFVCSRSIAQEITRHRKMSFLMESQRYVGYNREKFGGEIVYIIPEWVKDIMNYIASSIDWVTGQTQDFILQMPMTETVSKYGPIMSRAVNCWIDSMKKSEDVYMYLVRAEELKPEEARSVLTNDCKTELIMTGYLSDYQHFFDLRGKGTTGKPHPDIKILADSLQLIFIQNGLLH